MSQFECVEKHLYRRQYRCAGGDWSTKFYAIFVCHDGKRRTFPAGETVGDARDELGRLRVLDRGRFDFDAEKRQQQAAKVKPMLLSEWLDKYLDLCKDMPSYRTKKAQCGPLKRLMGHLTVAEASSRVRIMEYRSRRSSERLTRHGKAIEGTKITGATVNREVSCLITALNLAADEGLCEGAPKVKKERETARERILGDAEYKALLEVSDRWLQRVEIAASETGLDQGAILERHLGVDSAGIDYREGRETKDGSAAAGRNFSGSWRSVGGVARRVQANAERRAPGVHQRRETDSEGNAPPRLRQGREGC